MSGISERIEKIRERFHPTRLALKQEHYDRYIEELEEINQIKLPRYKAGALLSVEGVIITHARVRE